MSNSSHKERYITKLLLGFASIIAAVLVVFYSIFESSAKKGDWYFWAAITSFLLCGGIYFCLSAFIHKIKSDFNRRQQQRDQQKSRAADM